MIQTKDNYIYGNTAEKLEYDIYEQNRVLKAKKRQRTNNRAKTKAVFTVLFIFAISIAVIYRYASITELNYNIAKQEKIYNDIKNENIRLKIDLQNQVDLNKVKEIAESKLGMQKPDKYQVVFIRVPKEDTTKVAETDTKADNSKNNTISVLINKLGKITQLLY